MTTATLQFLDLIRNEYRRLELARLERERVLLRITAAELSGEITKQEAKQARKALLK